MSDIADRYRTLADAFERKIAAVDSEQWSNQSPCEAWTARSVVDHVVDVHGMMLGQIDRGLSPAPVDDSPMAAFQSARADVETVLDDPALSHTEYDGAFGRTNIAATIDQFLG
ncbi:MAG: maleylpyruvate isomerase N-terminal domain-containing protein, partial [Acidimicrobiia bacterium]|nr:maleylpyruvate isomerase N-terminal domain-containing protein [Acidimicrobiia bacterium]